MKFKDIKTLEDATDFWVHTNMNEIIFEIKQYIDQKLAILKPSPLPQFQPGWIYLTEGGNHVLISKRDDNGETFPIIAFVYETGEQTTYTSAGKYSTSRSSNYDLILESGKKVEILHGE